MTAARLGWLVTGVLLFTLPGCEVDVVDCDEEPDASVCRDDEDGDDEDGDDGLDGSVPEDDADVADDGGVDGGGDGGEGDAGEADAGPTGEPLDAIAFCQALYGHAIALRDKFDDCSCPSADVADRDAFLQRVYGLGANTIENCELLVENDNITYEATRAQACADAHNDQFEGAPTACPAVGTGYDLNGLESQIGHGALLPVQIPACRLALKGKVAEDGACTEAFECAPGLRCRTAPGGGNTCQDPVPAGGECERASECGDGLICVGFGTGVRTCRPNDPDELNTQSCQASKECQLGLVCVANDCSAPDSGDDDNICR